VDVQYSFPDEDAQVYRIAEQRPDAPIRIRIQPDLYVQRDGRALYMAWRQVFWRVECATPGEAIALKDALHAFFSCCLRSGADNVRMHLETLLTPIQ
jgi:hypothetical protein